MTVLANVTVTDSEGKILALFPYDATNNSGRSERRAEALRQAVGSLGYAIPQTGRQNNGTIYRSEQHEIGLLNSGCTPAIGDYL